MGPYLFKGSLLLLDNREWSKYYNGKLYFLEVSSSRPVVLLGLCTKCRVIYPKVREKALAQVFAQCIHELTMEDHKGRPWCTFI
jgi:hypothetical protein